MMMASMPSSVREMINYSEANPDIVFGRVKPTINKQGLRKYPADYNPIFGILGADRLRQNSCM